MSKILSISVTKEVQKCTIEKFADNYPFCEFCISFALLSMLASSDLISSSSAGDTDAVDVAITVWVFVNFLSGFSPNHRIEIFYSHFVYETVPFFLQSKIKFYINSLLIYIFFTSCKPEIVLPVLQIKVKTISCSRFVKIKFWVKLKNEWNCTAFI